MLFRSEDAKAIHDQIITTMDFAYQDDGVTASDSGIAHSIIGAIEGTGVCESYARTYQLLCTYYGINNIFVKSESHAWNIIQLDDGIYYNVDCTWDDSGDTPTYKYFAKGTDSFYQTHTPCTPEGIGSYFQYDLPEISTSDYKVPVATETTTETTTTTMETTTTTTETTTTTTETTTTTSETTTTTPITTTSTTAPQPIKGDINGDGIFNIADVLILQKYLLCEIELDNPENADFYPDNIINSFDLCCMKSALLKK